MSSSSNDLGALRVPWGVICVSLLAFPVSYVLSLCSAMEDSRLVLLAGVIACSAIVPITYYCVVRSGGGGEKGGGEGRDPYFYIFTLFSFTSMVDLALGLTIDGHTDVLQFYLAQGEVYLTTAHGLWINLWDGSFHYACYLLMAACLSRRGVGGSRGQVLLGGPLVRTVGLLWAGSILNSMICLFVASAVGNHATHIKPSYLLNIPYALFPGVFLWRIMQSRPSASTSFSSAVSTPAAIISERKPFWLWLIDVPLLVLTFASGCLCVLRGLAVLRSSLPAAKFYATEVEAHLLDPAAYPTLQMVTYAFYGLPYLVWCMVRLWVGVPSAEAPPAEMEAARSFRDWTIVALGAALQGTFSYVGAAMHQGLAFQSPDWIPQSRQTNPLATFVAANTLLLLTPILILARINFGTNVRASSHVAAAAAPTTTRSKTQ